MNGKRAVLVMFCMIVLAQASFAYYDGYDGYSRNYYGDSSYDRSYGANGFRGFNINFDARESTGSGFSTTTTRGFREGDFSFDRNGFFGRRGSFGNSVDNKYLDRYSDTVTNQYSYNDKDTRTWGNYYGGLNNYYTNNYRMDYPDYGNYGGYSSSGYGGYGNYGYGGNYPYGSMYSGNSGRMMLGYYDGGRMYV